MMKLNIFFCLIYYVIIDKYAATSAINSPVKVPGIVNPRNISNNRSFGVPKDNILVVDKNYQNWKSIAKSPKGNSLPENIQNKTCLKRQRCNLVTQQLNTKSIRAVNPTFGSPFKSIAGASNNISDAPPSPKIGNNSKLSNDGESSFRAKRQIVSEPQLKLNTTIGGTRRDRLSAKPGSNLTVEFKECGFVFCFAEDFHLNNSVHRWDYHVKWTIPSHVKENVHSDRIFVLGDHFQMAHAYLVFRRFDKSYEGEYICSLTLFEKTVIDIHVNLVFSNSLSKKQCIVGND